MDSTKTTTNWIIAGLVALAVIIGGGWLIAKERSGAKVSGAANSADVRVETDNSPSVSDANETKSLVTSQDSVSAQMNPTTSASGETITVADQPAGATVKVADVNLSKPSWVVIRDTRGWALGAVWLNASTKDAEVSLLRDTVAGQTYQAVIYTDDGDKKFSLHAGDMLVTDSGGAPVASTFTAK